MRRFNHSANYSASMAVPAACLLRAARQPSAHLALALAGGLVIGGVGQRLDSGGLAGPVVDVQLAALGVSGAADVGVGLVAAGVGGQATAGLVQRYLQQVGRWGGSHTLGTAADSGLWCCSS